MESEEVAILGSDGQQDVEMAMVSARNCALPVAPQLYCDSVCPFFGHENSIRESKERSKSAMKLCGLIIFYLLAMVVEIFGGIKANSLAVMTDAAHLLIDIAGFSISLFSVWASGWEATSQYSFGFNRLEVLGALASMQLIWLISFYLSYEAVNRIIHKCAKVDGSLMFGVAAFGFIINLIVVTCLGHNHAHHACDHDHDFDHHNHHHHYEGEKLCTEPEEDGTNLESSPPVKNKILNINLQGAYLHVMADLIQSAGVMIAGAIMWWKPHWCVVDLICTLAFAAFALTTTIPMLVNIFRILMEKTPSEINIDRLERDLRLIEGVQTIHDLHVWTITIGKIALSCHVVAESGVNLAEMLHKIRDYCQKKYRIHHVTIQVE